jgi:phosphoribosylamine--glycine ligase
VHGLGDEAEKIGIRVFGPKRGPARLEGSKVFMKQFCSLHGIPTARYEIFRNYADAHTYFTACNEYPLVVKIDGLADGKGVKLVQTPLEAYGVAHDMLVQREFGTEGGSSIVVEQFVEGPEFSIIGMCDGKNVLLLPPARDYKRRSHSALSPNTGGMGAYAPAGDPDIEHIRDTFFFPTLRALANAGTPYHGILYAGLKGTSEGSLKLLEYNCRGGDPEMQVLLPLFYSDPVPLMLATSTLDGFRGVDAPFFRNEVAVGTNVVIKTYPGRITTGKRISGIEDAEKLGHVFHAGTERVGRNFYTAGGRVLTCVAVDTDRETARGRSLEMARMIRFEGADFRNDIAA